MKNAISKVIVCFAVFILTLFVSSSIYNKGNEEMTATMTEASLPLVHITTNGIPHNYMHGLRQELNGSFFRDTITNSWAEEPDNDGKSLVVNHVREGEVPGTHIIRWDSAVDAITLRHDAKSREGFALGAVMSAEWAASRKGVLNIRDFVDSLVK